jgi:hypothetical protein
MHIWTFFTHSGKRVLLKRRNILMSRGSLTKEKISLRVNPPCVVHLLDEGVVLLPESHGGTIRYLLPDLQVSPILRFEKENFFPGTGIFFEKVKSMINGSFASVSLF